MNYDTRESWLIAALDESRKLFLPAGYDVPPIVKVSCGWPARRALSLRQPTIGQCWAAKASKAGVPEIFISPLIDDSVKALDVLVHEMCHAVVGHEAKHGPVFRKCALAVGLQGKMTATEAGPELEARLKAIVESIGQYPHAALVPMGDLLPKQSTRMLKIVCPQCGYLVRTTKRWLEIGVPTCVCGTTMEGPEES